MDSLSNSPPSPIELCTCGDIGSIMALRRGVFQTADKRWLQNVLAMGYHENHEMLKGYPPKSHQDGFNG